MKFPDEFVEKLATNKQIKFGKWHQMKISNSILYTHFSLIKQTCRDTYLMPFKFKFLHRIIPTNTYLYKVNIKDNGRCSFCKNELESLEHLF